MKRHVSVMTGGTVLALAIGLLAVSDTQSADTEKEVQEAVLKLADSIAANPATAKEQAQALYQKLGPDALLDVMNSFKPRSKGGVGVGKETDMIRPDGIELKINALGIRVLPAASLQREKDALIRAAQITRAIAELADFYPPKKDPAKWMKYDADMKQGADQLIKALQAGDSMQVKTAANNLAASCTDCHADFRD